MFSSMVEELEASGEDLDASDEDLACDEDLDGCDEEPEEERPGRESTGKGAHSGWEPDDNTDPRAA